MGGRGEFDKVSAGKKLCKRGDEMGAHTFSASRRIGERFRAGSAVSYGIQTPIAIIQGP